MKDATGRLQIHLRRQPEGLEVEIESSRLTGASRVFIGKTLGETVRTLPSLFSVCATAQTVACLAAGEAALGLGSHPGVSRARLLLVDMETVREHLWRLLLDWPRFLGEAPQGPAMAQVMAAHGHLRQALTATADPLLPGAADVRPAPAAATQALAALTTITTQWVLGQPPAHWLAHVSSQRALNHWSRTGATTAARLIHRVLDQGWSGLGRSRVAVLPPLSAAALEAHLGGPQAPTFIATPLWQGAPAETTPFARQLAQPLVADLARELGNGLLPRLAAQLVELARLLDSVQARLAALADPNGTAEADGATTTPTLAGPGDPFTAGHNPRQTTMGTALPGCLTPADTGAEIAAALPSTTGLAQVQAARGLLVHRLSLAGERLVDYRILAPTEWNFHPQGAAAQGLATLPLADDATLRRLAGLFITALDPCVAYEMDIT